VALYIDAILGEISLAKRREMLKKVAMTGVDLGCVYAQTLQRIRDQKGSRSRLGMEVLIWAVLPTGQVGQAGPGPPIGHIGFFPVYI